MTAARPAIPRQRDAIAAEAKRCANSRALHQNRLLDELVIIDAIDRRIADLVDALATAPQ